MVSNPHHPPDATSAETRPKPVATPLHPNRLPLSGRSPRRFSFELRLKLWLFALAVPAVTLTAALSFELTSSVLLATLSAVAVAIVWTVAVSVLFERITRPLQTLSNVVAALCEDDFSFRARGARRGDSLGDLALEINALASTLQHQRASAIDALTLVELVMNSMPSPVLAFDVDLRLRLLNPAAEKAFNLNPNHTIGCTVEDLALTNLFAENPQLIHDQGEAVPFANSSTTSSQSLGSSRWSIYRTTFRLHGIPHTLFVLADVSAALRDEERLAWQRLIRVLGHEINNSLTPIKSIAGTLRSQLSAPSNHSGTGLTRESGFDRGLAVIEDRAESLNRFLQAYQHLSRLPVPDLQPTPLHPLLSRVVQLETRIQVHLAAGPETNLFADCDQLQQLLINLIRNAADAALDPELTETGRRPMVEVNWTITGSYAVLQVVDNGGGLLNAANLFVPFYTTKPGGTGIGLVLAQQIATAHNGSVTLSNRRDRLGCEAEVILPLTPGGQG